MKKINVLLSSCAVLILSSCFGRSAMKSTSKVVEPTRTSRNVLPPSQEIPIKSTQRSDGDLVNPNGSAPPLLQPSKNSDPPPGGSGSGGSGSTMYPSMPVSLKDDILLLNTMLNTSNGPINNQITSALNNCNKLLDHYNHKDREAALIVNLNLCQKMMAWLLYNLSAQMLLRINRQGSYLNGRLLAIEDSTSQNKTLCYATKQTKNVILEQVESWDNPEYCFATVSYQPMSEQDMHRVVVTAPPLKTAPSALNSPSVSMILQEENSASDEAEFNLAYSPREISDIGFMDTDIESMDTASSSLEEEDSRDVNAPPSKHRVLTELPLVSISDEVGLREDVSLKHKPGRLSPIKNFFKRSHRLAAQSSDPTDNPKKSKSKRKFLRLFRSCTSKQ